MDLCILVFYDNLGLYYESSCPLNAVGGGSVR